MPIRAFANAKACVDACITGGCVQTPEHFRIEMLKNATTLRVLGGRVLPHKAFQRDEPRSVAGCSRFLFLPVKALSQGRHIGGEHALAPDQFRGGRAQGVFQRMHGKNALSPAQVEH